MTHKKFRNGQKSETGIRLHFLGAVRSVTGSFHLFEYRNGGKITRFFVDCGMMQEDESLNFKDRLPKGIKPRDLDFGIFTHAHTDHIGFFPKLVADGFKGPAYATAASIDLMKLLLPDSGNIQELRAREKAQLPPEEREGQITVPLYTKRDGANCLELLKAMDFNKTFSPAPNITVEFRPSSHLLGAALVVLQIGKGAGKRTIVCSGDIGRQDMPCLQNISRVKNADYVLCESTYGDRVHPKRDRQSALADVINKAYQRAKVRHKVYGAGKIIIPVFAIGRSQTILYDLRMLVEARRIPNLQVFVDSPMSIKATDVYRKYRELFPKKDKARANAVDLFRTPKFMDVWSKSKSVKLDEPCDEPIIILSSSGMATGGRVLEHLKNRLPGSQNSVVFVGHQSEGTNGFMLTEGDAESILIDDEQVNVRASIELMPDYSGHGDWYDIMAWLLKFKQPPKKIFLVHGELEPAIALQSRIKEKLLCDVDVPELGQFVDLD